MKVKEEEMVSVGGKAEKKAEDFVGQGRKVKLGVKQQMTEEKAEEWTLKRRDMKS